MRLEWIKLELYECKSYLPNTAPCGCGCGHRIRMGEECLYDADSGRIFKDERCIAEYEMASAEARIESGVHF